MCPVVHSCPRVPFIGLYSVGRFVPFLAFSRPYVLRFRSSLHTLPALLSVAFCVSPSSDCTASLRCACTSVGRPAPLLFFSGGFFFVLYVARYGFACRFYSPLLRGAARWRASPVTASLALLLSVLVPRPPFPPRRITAGTAPPLQKKNASSPLRYVPSFFFAALLGHSFQYFIKKFLLPVVSIIFFIKYFFCNCKKKI